MLAVSLAGFGDDLAAGLAEMRAHAESLMLDSGTAYRPTGETTYDSGEQASAPEVVPLFSSPCKIQSRVAESVEEQVGERTATTIRVILHLPAATLPLQVDDEWHMSAVDPVSSVPTTRRYRIRAPFEKTLATARRYDVEEVVS
jgi:hypothetical protein